METEILIKIILIAFSGALITLDRTAAGQFMISRPIVASFLIGMLFGHLLPALAAGALIELVWINRLSIGTNVPPNETIAAVLASGGVALFAESVHDKKILISVIFVFSLAAGVIARYFSMLISRINGRIAVAADKKLKAEPEAGIGRYILLGLVNFFSVYFIFLLVFLTAEYLFCGYIFSGPALRISKGLAIAYGIIPFVGVAAANELFMKRYYMSYFFTGFLLAFLVYFILKMPALPFIALFVLFGMLLSFLSLDRKAV
ncbi:MAG: hypothetical protein A2X49_07810 [Lentisphaerae bacterium GWF2_52_8]|nr:MAG: hypothetical protein A2X49_07810 [Lentisphaerae bacterium GWF2_52_8]